MASSNSDYVNFRRRSFEILSLILLPEYLDRLNNVQQPTKDNWKRTEEIISLKAAAIGRSFEKFSCKFSEGEIDRRNLLKFNGNGFVLFARQYHTHTARVFPDERVLSKILNRRRKHLSRRVKYNGWLLYPPRRRMAKHKYINHVMNIRSCSRFCRLFVFFSAIISKV